MKGVFPKVLDTHTHQRSGTVIPPSPAGTKLMGLDRGTKPHGGTKVMALVRGTKIHMVVLR